MKTPLYEWHRSRKARMVPFAGWDMPILYSGLIEEHRTVRDKVGLFDVSHMGEFFVRGQEALTFLQYVTTNDVQKLKDGASQYSLLLNEKGTVIDDIIVYRIGAEDFLICVNASNTDKDFKWLVSQASQFKSVTLENKSSEFGLIAVQGPQALATVQKLSKTDASAIARFHFIETRLAQIQVYLSRTGYTGEDGFEIFVPWAQTEALWQQLMEAGQSYGVLPVGLGARDTLRIEMKYSLYGHEINDATNPLEAGLGWTVKLDKGDFIGRDSLLRLQKEGLKRQLVCLEMLEAGVPREGYTVHAGTELIGSVTSGTFSPSLERGIAIAYVTVPYKAVGTELCIKIRNDTKRARVVPAPFYTSTAQKRRSV